jgi:2-dehydropantoate 2-reductase
MNSVALVAKSPLSIAVIGVGRIGSTFAYQLARAGHDVTVIARPGSMRLQQLRRDHGIVLKTGERAEMRVADELDEQTAYDLVVVTMLAHQVDVLLPALQRSKAQCVHFMFVTFEPERLRDAIGNHRCTFGMPAVMATLDSEGKLKPTISRQKTLHSDQRWVELFRGAGMPSASEADMLL